MDAVENDYFSFSIINLITDTIIADPDAILVFKSLEFDAATRPRRFFKVGYPT
jgi:hypothetical protein